MTSSSPEDEDYKNQMRELFNRVDKNKDGRIQFQELKEALIELSLLKPKLVNNEDGGHNLHVKSIFNKIRKKESKEEEEEALDFRDFVDYVNYTDKKIELIFNDLDSDNNGIIDEVELKKAFARLNIMLSDKDIEKMMKHIQRDKSLRLDKRQWKNFFRFAPNDELEQMLRFWRREAFVDYGEQFLPNDYTKEEIESGLWWRNMLAGAYAGVITRTFTAPLDRVKIFMQVHGSNTRMHILSAIKNMIKEGGVMALWRGNGMSVVKIAPESAIKCMVYEEIKRSIGKDGQSLPPWQRFISGSLAGCAAQSAIYPLEVLKTRLALRSTGQYTGAFDCIRKIYKLEGIRTFYRGYLINTIGIVPAAGVDLALYETLKAKYREIYPDNPQPSTLTVILFANISATASMYSSYPLYLIRTRLQSSLNPNDTITSISATIWKNEGILGFFHGSLANLAKFAPAASCGYLAFDHIAQYIGLKFN